MGLQVGYTIGLVHDETSTQWACAEVGYTMGLVHNGTSTQWACMGVGYAMGLVHNRPAGGLHNGTHTQQD